MLTGNGFMENEPEQQKHHESPESQKQGGQLRQIGLLTVIVSDLIGYTGVGIGIGYLAWSKWNAPWWVLVATSIAGLCLAFYRVYQLTKREF
jgi:F0F1-type ATP synthase assembly protein I